MKRGTRLFLRTVLVLIGIGALAFLLLEPQVEGRNAHATLFAIYFKDPFLSYAYVASIPFFVGLHQAFKALGHTARDASSTLRSLQTIRYCAIALIGLVALGEVFIMLGDSDDRAGGVFMGALIAFASIVVGTTATVIERGLHAARHRSSASH